MDTPLYNNFVGIDIAKLKFDVAIRLANNKFKHKVFANTTTGFDELIQWLQSFGQDFFFIMEATNTYHEALADFLHGKDFKVVVINPKCMPNFAKSSNLRSKTDKVDAKLLAEFACKNVNDLRLYQPRPADERALLCKVRQLDHLKSVVAKETVRMSMMTDADCIAISKAVIDDVNKRIKELKSVIKSLVKNNAAMTHNMKLLTGIPAIGEQSAWLLLAHLGDGTRFANGKAAATFFGLTPMIKQSGTSVHTVVGISKIGHRDVRKALFAPAMNFAFGRWANGVYAGFVQRLLNAGKAKMSVIVALMRKLVTIAQAVLKHQRPFNPDMLAAQS